MHAAPRHRSAFPHCPLHLAKFIFSFLSALSATLALLVVVPGAVASSYKKRVMSPMHRHSMMNLATMVRIQWHEKSGCFCMSSPLVAVADI